MKVNVREKTICFILAIILFFLGMSVEISTADTSFSCSTNMKSTTESVIRSANYVEEETVCTLNMLGNGCDFLRANMSSTITKGQYRAILSFLIVGSFLQYLFYYQSAESKEDGQLFLCRTVVVDYIHLKDSGE